jgi:hypothetical protein
MNDKSKHEENDSNNKEESEWMIAWEDVACLSYSLYDPFLISCLLSVLYYIHSLALAYFSVASLTVANLLSCILSRVRSSL